MTHTTSEVLNLAADLIEKRGWTKGNDGTDGIENAGLPLCIQGALCIAGGMGWEDRHVGANLCPAGSALRSYLTLPNADIFGGGVENHLRLGAGELWRWNDFTAADQAEVIEVLRATALIEAARESAAVRDGMNHQTVLQDEFNRLPKLYPDTKAEPDPHTNMVYAVIGDTEYATELAEVCS